MAIPGYGINARVVGKSLLRSAVRCDGLGFIPLNYIYRRSLSSSQPFASQVRIDTTKLQVKERNDIIDKNPADFYPSMTQLNTNPAIEPFAPITVNDFIALGKENSTKADIPSKLYRINGRVRSIRFSGKKICFIDIYSSESKNSHLQVIINLKQIPNVDAGDFYNHLQFLGKHDYIQVYGFLGYSSNSNRTLSLKATLLPKILSPAQLPLPSDLVNPAKISKNRVLAYQVNGITDILVRSRIISLIRKFYTEKRGYIEVETPILSGRSNGANAEPFVTQCNHTLNGEDRSLELRVAPELWLKRLIIGGLDRIFEIGKVFRNEGIDATHNPEFTMLESYETYLSMNDLIVLSEQLFKHLLLELQASGLKLPIVNQLANILKENDWHFKRVEFLPTLSEELGGVDFYSGIDLNNVDELLSVIPRSDQEQIFSHEELNNPAQHLSPQKILNKLSSFYIEEKYCNSLLPTLIFHHPSAMSPLAKLNTSDWITSKRFEVYINGKEYINAYEEENCPQEQLRKFRAQQSFKSSDKESLTIDLPYIEAMRSGMPPTGGLGLGIDRLCMLLMEKNRIEQVLPFGCLDDVNVQ